MQLTDAELLGDMFSVGVPYAFYDGRDLDNALATSLETSKRQIREWRKQKAIKVVQNKGAFMIVKVGKRAGFIVRVKANATD